MPKRKDLRVISGGKSSGKVCRPGLTEDCHLLLQKAEHYRIRAANFPGEDISNLIGDMVDAVRALDRLEHSADSTAQRRALEYRRLIADLEIEIVSALEGP